jgi:SAM-dependent methyltransferase
VFTADWLALREPADFAARSAAVTRRAVDGLPRDREVRALDLASGTGANARYLADRIGRGQNWLLVDYDRTLLAQAGERMTSWAEGGGTHPLTFETRHVDLRALDASLFDGRSLVTASALLDLVSEPWLHALADRCRGCGGAALFALTYDGRLQCEPAEDEDETIRALVNRHQRRDKGFGLALGPTAVGVGVRSFTERGFHVERERSDWMLGPGSHELQSQLIEGWASAALEIEVDKAAAIASWRWRRLAHVQANRSRLVVGHEDFCAILPRS